MARPLTFGKNLKLAFRPPARHAGLQYEEDAPPAVPDTWLDSDDLPVLDSDGLEIETVG